MERCLVKRLIQIMRHQEMPRRPFTSSRRIQAMPQSKQRTNEPTLTSIEEAQMARRWARMNLMTPRRSKAKGVAMTWSRGPASWAAPVQCPGRALSAESASAPRRKAHPQRMVSLISSYVLANALAPWAWSTFRASRSGSTAKGSSTKARRSNHSSGRH